MNKATRIVVLVAALVTGACTGLASLEPPEVHVASLSLLESEPGSLEQQFEVGLRLLNPNNRDIAVEGVDFELEVNGQRLARGLSSEAFTLPRLGEQTTSMVVTTSVIDLLRQAYGLSGEALEYRVRGRLHLGSGFVRTVPFDHAGRIGP
jgi:LEA14-like dessication related protein